MSYETVYAIASGKGGVGKTTTTVNLGTALAQAGERVAIVDADLGMANLAGFVGLNPDSTTLSDVLAESASVDDATYRLAENIVAVPSGTSLDDYAETAPEQLRDVVDELRSQYDAVLLDVGAGVSHETVLPLGLADAVVVVSTPEPAAVHDSTKTLELTERAGGEVTGLVLTRTRPETDVSYEEIADQLGLPLLGTIPEDPAARESVYAGTPLVVHAPDSPASAAYRQLTADLAGVDVLNDRPDGGSESGSGSGTPPADDSDASADATRDSEAQQDDVSSAITEAEAER
ncbi:septum site-determining protein MinD [Natronococcus pandeyae]|uniref:Septum site-determining protein MinD n=1 Tax=Natronococcus pandeyae TaxID=2055836 RepID=A0A8J8Q760_9EURY|nr:cell division ATPase MinD [Natronococcus pandeyae]TYL38505.1 septum site-determining protein MinD [Natronococcus pandeyae]